MPILAQYDFSQESLIKDSLFERMRELAYPREKISFAELLKQEGPQAAPKPKPPALPPPDKSKDGPKL